MNCPQVYSGKREKVLNEIRHLSIKCRRVVVINYASFLGASGFEYQSRLATMTGGGRDFPLILTQALEEYFETYNDCFHIPYNHFVIQPT